GISKRGVSDWRSMLDEFQSAENSFSGVAGMPDRFRTGLVGLFDDRLQQAGCKVLVHLEPVDPLMQQAPCHHAGLGRRSHMDAIGVAAIFRVVRSIDNVAGYEHTRSLDSPGLQGFALRDDPAGRVCRVVYGGNTEVEKKLRKEI